MEKLCKYGDFPFKAALIHGGPGAAGEMAPVGRELSHYTGILEPFQTEYTIEGQLDELKSTLEKYADLPVILIGYSWGAWLSFIFASQYSGLVSKLILVSSGPFEQKYADKIMELRLSRLNTTERLQVTNLLKQLDNTNLLDKNEIFAKLGKIIIKADTFESIEYPEEKIDCNYEIYENIWRQASQMRKSGKLLEFADNIKCPVIAIHGDYDPHPYDGVKEPLSKYIKDFRFVLLENCGHKPWVEKYAKDKFYEILKNEL